MPVHRHPILLWEDFDDGWTAALVEDPAQAAFAPTSAEVVRSLREFLEWRLQEQPYFAEPDLFDVRLTTVKVEVRPEYEVQEVARQPRHGRRAVERTRTYACDEPVVLPVACVHGRDRNELLVCTMPLLGGRFTYSSADSMKGLVVHYVQRLLRGVTPQALSRHLPPRTVLLEEVVVHAPRDRSVAAAGAGAPELEALRAVAEPIEARGWRRQLSRPWERDEQVDRLVTALTRDAASVLLLGEAGAGKTAVLAEAARKVERMKWPDSAGAAEGEMAATAMPAKHRFWVTSAARLIAGMAYLGQWQERVETIIEELSQVRGVLCVESLLDLVRVGGVGPGDSVGAFLVPYLQRGELRVVAEATPAELDACRRLLPGLAESFQAVAVPTFDRSKAIAALRQVAAAHSRNLGVEVEGNLVDVVYKLFRRFLPYQGFPGRATAFVGELFDRAARGKQASVTPAMAVERMVRHTGLPEAFLRDDVRLSREAVLAELRRQVIGQPGACEAAADLIMTFKAGLNDPNRPPGVLLFTGPTGVGKTELAKAISQYFFGHGEQKERLIRLDMSEYAGPGAAARLLGDGRGEPSPLVRRIRQQPFAVVLLDEIEKAAPEVFDLLLGVFDEGRLTDAYGRLTTFRSAVLIMTSNLGAARPEPFGFARPAPGAARYDEEAMGFFRPEFYNRIDAVVAFEPLTLETMLTITAKELEEVARREGLARHGLKLEWSADVARHLAERGYDRRYGARPLQRALEQQVVAPLSRFLVDRRPPRGTTVRLDLVGGAIIVRTGVG